MGKYLHFVLILYLARNSEQYCLEDTKTCKAFEQNPYRYYNHDPYEICTSYGYEYICTGIKISYLVTIQDLLDKLNVSESDITTIPAGAFSSFVNLTHLTMDFDNIETLELGAFNGLHSLQSLSLRGNRIQLVEKGIFNFLDTLSELDLSSNLLATIEDGAFAGCRALKTINLGHNHLTDITKGVSKSFADVSHLNVSSNSLSYFDTNISVVNLDISGNKITYIGSLKTDLNYLNASNNCIQTLNPASFLNATSLIRLNLNFNYISEINSSTFNFTYNLEHLLLNSNNLKEINLGTFAKLTNLNHLDLSNNSIIHLEYGIFYGLKNLEILDVSDNKLITLAEYNMYSLQKLHTLRLNNNYIQYIDASYICNEFDSSEKRTISINNNQISCPNLIEIIRQLSKCGFLVESGQSFNVKNIQGIACTGDDQITVAKKGGTSVPVFDVAELDNEFKKTDFYRYLHQGFPPVNHSIFKDIDSKLNSSSLYKLLFSNFTNLDDFDQRFVNSSFHKFFVGFNNSDFVKFMKSNVSQSGLERYFDRDFFASKFFEYMNKTFPAVMNNTLQRNFATSNFVNFLETDFKNTAFFKFVSDFESNRAAVSAKYTSHDDSTNSSSIVTNVLLALIAIVLIVAMFKSLLLRSIRKRVVVCSQENHLDEEEQRINLAL